MTRSHGTWPGASDKCLTRYTATTTVLFPGVSLAGLHDKVGVPYPKTRKERPRILWIRTTESVFNTQTLLSKALVSVPSLKSFIRHREDATSASLHGIRKGELVPERRPWQECLGCLILNCRLIVCHSCRVTPVFPRNDTNHNNFWGPISRTARFARYADERNVGCVYHRKILYNQEPNNVYRVRESHNRCFLSRSCSIYKAN